MKLVTEENISALRYWAETNKIVSKALRDLEKSKKLQTESYSFSKIVSKYLGYRNFAIAETETLHETEITAYFDAIKKSIGKAIAPRLFFDKKTLKKAHWGCSTWDEKNRKQFTAEATVIKREDFSYIAVPDTESANRDMHTVYIITGKDHIDKAIADFYDLLKKYDLSRQSVFVWDGYRGFFRKAEFKYDASFGVFPDVIEREIQLIEKLLGTTERRNVLFYGHAGTGKTTACERIMITALSKGVKTVRVDKGESLSKLYESVASPALIVLEDFDLFNQLRHTGIGGVNSETLQALSIEQKGVITLATSNNIQGLDSASVRAGRIDKSYFFDYPDNAQKLAITGRMIEKYDLKADKDLLDFVCSHRLTGAIIEAIVKEQYLYKTIAVEKTFAEITKEFKQYSCNVEFIKEKSAGF